MGIPEATQEVCIEGGERNEMGIPGMVKGRFRKQGRMEKGMSKSQEDSSLPGEWPIPGLR